MQINPWCKGYQPKLILILPNVVVLSVMLFVYHAPPVPLPSTATHTSIADPSRSASSLLPTPNPVPEGSAAWLANIQAIQNLMGAVYVSFCAYVLWAY